MRRPHCAHRRGCWWHRLVIDAYRDQVDVWERDLEEFSIGYATEAAEFEELHPRPRFRDTLVTMRQELEHV